MSLGNLRELVRVERTMRLLRLGLAVLAVLQPWLYTPPPNRAVPYPPVFVAAAVVGALLVLNLVSIAGGTSDISRIRTFGLVQLAGDTLLALAVVWLFAFDPLAPLWALLIAPVIEGAFRFGLRAALWVWLASAAGYVVREVIAQGQGVATDVSSATYRLGVLLVVALSVGWMANSLRSERMQSERRAELLAAVARAGAAAELSSFQVLDSVVESLVTLGYEASNIALFSDSAEAYRVEAGRGLPAQLTTEPWQPLSGIARLVRDRGEAVVMQDYQRNEHALDVFIEEGVQVAVGVPIRAGSRILGVLVARSRSPRTVSEEELEALGLLADQAGRALENARRFEAERRSAEGHERASLHDELTGVGNRRHANKLLGSLAPGDSVVLVDCDHFKEVNDTHGHVAGDATLVALASYLRAAVRDADAVARFGGDEFLLVLRDAEGASANVAERLIRGWRAGDPRTTLSLGVATHVEGRSPLDTLGQADAALLTAKRSGRNQACSSSGAPLDEGPQDERGSG